MVSPVLSTPIPDASASADFTHGLSSSASAISQQADEPDCGSTPKLDVAPTPDLLLTCSTRGCNAKPFKRHAELRRHELKHRTDRRSYPCTALDCNRIGVRAFYRGDNLKDHMIAGHDDNTLFECPSATTKSWKVLVPRDIMAVHLERDYLHVKHLRSLNDFRGCPIPKCSFRVNTFTMALALDKLQNHLRAKHDAKGRANYSDLILARGYRAATVHVTCPVCADVAEFQTHYEFYCHFMEVHFHGRTGFSYDREDLMYWQSRLILEKCSFVPEEVRQHRRTILSLWPSFARYPVWQDIICGHTET